ncbi:MAG: hypothetical protein JOZ32_18045 [Bryobacterales bacterium]|nr:hypothetical protein [Bryobacterales bacterium]
MGYTLRGTLRLLFGGRLLDVVHSPLSYIAAALLVSAVAAFYRLFYLAPLILVVGIALGDAPKSNRAGLLLAAVLALWNFVFMAYPESRPEFNAPLRFALTQRDAWPPGSAIVFHRFQTDLWTISYLVRFKDEKHEFIFHSIR